MNALTIIFICIFVATAILTLASLPGWIKIPDGYRKALFTALILEVVGCVIVTYKDLQTTKLNIKPNVHTWIALSNNGKLIQIQVNDSLIGLSKEEFSKNTVPEFRLEFDENCKNTLFIKTDSSYIGCIKQENLKDLNFFSSIDQFGSGFEQVEFKLTDRGWQSNKKFPIWKEDVLITITDTGYVISNINLTKIYASNKSFNAEDRILHFFRPDNECCYLIRINSANLLPETATKFINFFIIRFKPSL